MNCYDISSIKAIRNAENAAQNGLVIEEEDRIQIGGKWFDKRELIETMGIKAK